MRLTCHISGWVYSFIMFGHGKLRRQIDRSSRSDNTEVRMRSLIGQPVQQQTSSITSVTTSLWTVTYLRRQATLQAYNNACQQVAAGESRYRGRQWKLLITLQSTLYRILTVDTACLWELKFFILIREKEREREREFILSGQHGKLALDQCFLQQM